MARRPVGGRHDGRDSRALRDGVRPWVHRGSPVRRRVRSGERIRRGLRGGARRELRRRGVAARRRDARHDRAVPPELRARRRPERRRRGLPRGARGATAMIDLLSLAPDAARDALAQWLAARGEPDYRAKQIVPRLWQRPAASWDDASDLPTGLRRALAEAFPLRRLDLTGRQLSRDGTRSEEHTSELQSPCNLVCRLLLEKKNIIRTA